MWFDTSNTQLYVYTGSAWTLIGPTTVAGSGVTQVFAESPEDNTGVKQSILEISCQRHSGGRGIQSCIHTKLTEPLGRHWIRQGFSSIAQGIQLSSSVSSAKFRGTATDSDALGGVAAANYSEIKRQRHHVRHVRNLNDTGLTLGAGSDVTMTPCVR